jgi:hypothetical protein
MLKLRRICVSLLAVTIGAVSILVGVAGCTLKKKAEPDPVLQAAKGKQLSPEESEELLEQMGSNWLYGQGVGETAMNIGGVLLFPPYAIYLIGNAALSLSGYEPLTVADALPDEEGTTYREAYDSIAAGPGRFAAAVAGREYRTKEVIKEDYKRILVGEGANSERSEREPLPIGGEQGEGR